MERNVKLIAEAIKYFVIFYNIKRKCVLENDCQGTTSSSFKFQMSEAHYRSNQAFCHLSKYKRKYVLQNDCQGTISSSFKVEPAARNSALGYARTATATWKIIKSISPKNHLALTKYRPN